MKRTIIDKLTNRGIAKKLTNLAYGIILGVMGGAMLLPNYNEKINDLPYETAEAMLKLNGRSTSIDVIASKEIINMATLEHLKEYPNILNDFNEENYETMDRLREIVLGEQHKYPKGYNTRLIRTHDDIILDNILTARLGDHRLQLSKEPVTTEDRWWFKGVTINRMEHFWRNIVFTGGDVFVSETKLGWDLEYIVSLDKVYDKTNGYIYKLNRETHEVEQDVIGVFDVLELPGGKTYIDLGKQLIVRETNARCTTKIVYESKDGFVAKRVRGTPFGMLIKSEKDVELLGDKELDPELWEDLEVLITKGITNNLFEGMVDQSTKITLSDEYLAVGDIDQIRIMKVYGDYEIQKTQYYVFKDWADFKLTDVNNDGEEDLIALESGGQQGTPEAMVYTDWDSRQRQVIANLPIDFRFSHQPDEDVKWANPKLLKFEIALKIWDELIEEYENVQMSYDDEYKITFEKGKKK